MRTVDLSVGISYLTCHARETGLGQLGSYPSLNYTPTQKSLLRDLG